MRFPPRILDEIRARLNVSDVVGRTVALKKKGREYAGLSPFKSEKTPSFFVNDQKGFFHCFASGEHGDIFGFLMKTEGLSFPEAVERLAEETGVELPKEKAENPERQDERKRLVQLLERAAAFFEGQLNTGAARHARQYLDRRGLQRETQTSFRIGYAPNNRTALTEHLKGAGFSGKEIVRAVMQIAGEDIAVPYDRFRDRIMFPITDTRGQVVAFGGRALDPNQPAKYLNSPETPVFHKGHLLYNAHNARPAAHNADALIVVEGYMDVIALAQAGIGHAVAPLGTALTADQIKLMWRMCPEPILCFDGDSAGRKAAFRAVDTVLPHLAPGRSLHFAFMPSGADPDDVIRDEGPGAFDQILGKRQTLLETLWEREWMAGEWTTPERRAKLESELRRLVRSIADPSVRGHYGRIIAEKLQQAWQTTPQGYRGDARRTPRRGTEGWGRRPSGQKQRRSADGKAFGGAFPAFQPPHSTELKASPTVARHNGYNLELEALLLRIVLNNPWLIDEVVEELAAVDFRSYAHARLCNSLLASSADEKTLDTRVLRDHLHAAGHTSTLEQIERLATNKCHAFAEPDADRELVEQGWRHTLLLYQQQLLRGQLAEAEREYSEHLDEDTLARILELQRLIATLVPDGQAA